MADAFAQAGVVYLLHFDQPFKHAKHYLGWTADLELRLARHRGELEKDGRGSRLVEAVRHAGIGFSVARLWSGDRYLERRIKGRGLSAYCPLCSKRVRNPFGAVETFAAAAIPEFTSLHLSVGGNEEK